MAFSGGVSNKFGVYKKSLIFQGCKFWRREGVF